MRDGILKLKPSIKKKEIEKLRHRELAKEEEVRLSSTLNKFKNDISALLTLNSDINQSTRRLVDNISSDVLYEKIGKVKGIVSEKCAQIQELETELESLTRSIADQERHRKIIKENISLIEARHQIEKLRKEIDLVQKKKQKIYGHDTAAQELNEATAQISVLLEKKARKEGRRGGFVEEIRFLKVSYFSSPLGALSIFISQYHVVAQQRKLSQPEYKDVDERHRQARIKQETTTIACSDLVKYHTALDKALIRYHGNRIAEINKIIRELWTLTYKVSHH